MSRTQLGIRAKVYFVAGTTYTEVDAVNDWSEDVSWNTADANARDSAVDAKVKTTMALMWSGSVKRNGSDGALKVREALLTTKAYTVLILDGPKEADGSTGYLLDVLVTKGTNKQGRNDTGYDDVELHPTPTDNKPKAAKVTGGAGGTGGTLSYAEITASDTMTFA